jgi:hypothetical protein
MLASMRSRFLLSFVVAFFTAVDTAETSDFPLSPEPALSGAEGCPPW